MRWQSHADLHLGSGSAVQYCQEIREAASLVFFDASLASLDAVGQLLTILDTHATQLVPVVAGDDRSERLAELAELARHAPAGSVVAIGGGLTGDVARLANLLASFPERAPQVRRLQRPGTSGVLLLPDDLRGSDMRPTAMIPTTLGTGVDVSPVACFQHDHAKRIAVSSALRPDVSILDPKLTETLPPRMVELGIVEIMLRYIGPMLAGPSAMPLADQMAEIELEALARILEATRRGPLDSDQRLELALRSGLPRIGFSGAGRDSFGSKLWYLATALTDLMDIAKMDANLLLLPAVLRAIDAGDTRFGTPAAVARVAAAIGIGPDELSPFLGSPHLGLAALPDPDTVAIHAARIWGRGRPMLGAFTTNDLASLYGDALALQTGHTMRPLVLTGL